MSDRLYSAMKIAEALGVSRQYVNKYCTKHCNEARSGIGKGARININHPAMEALFESKGISPNSELKPAEERTSHLASKPVTQSESKAAKAKAKSKSSTTIGNPTSKSINGAQNLEALDITEHGNLTINEIAAFFGSAPDYRDWLDAKKKQVEVIEKETKIKITLGEYIRKDVVDTLFIGVVDAFNSRLLTDFCKSAPIDLRPAFESGKDDIQVESIIRTMLEKEIVTIVKAQARFAND